MNNNNLHDGSTAPQKYQNAASLPPDINSPPKHLPLKPLASRYQTVASLGNGSFGSVVLAKRRGSYHYTADKMNTLMNPIAGVSEMASSLVAIKTMNKRLGKLKDYTKVKEIRFILSIPSHPNLVFIHEMFIDNVDFRLHIVMETMDQNLYQFMKARKGQYFSEKSIKSILAQILAGIRHIHKHGYFHRDVKPENILISATAYKNGYFSTSGSMSPYTVKLADYGLARSIENKRPYTAYVSTRWYRSPEILLRQKYYSRPIDIWAFGAVAAEVATFRPLFPGNNELEQTWKILEVLGSPYPVTHSFETDPERLPLGGYWPEAQILANKLGFQLPPARGVRIENIVHKPELAPLADAIKACLTWDPKLRIDVESLCRMPYFKGTIVDTAEFTQSPPEAFARGFAAKTEVTRKSAKQKTLLLKKSANQLSPIAFVGSKDRKTALENSPLGHYPQQVFSNGVSKVGSPVLQNSPASISSNSIRYSYLNTAHHFPTAGVVPQFNESQCDSAIDLIISNTFSLKQHADGGIRNSYPNCSSSIESEGFDVETEQGKTFFAQRQGLGLYYDGLVMPFGAEYSNTPKYPPSNSHSMENKVHYPHDPAFSPVGFHPANHPVPIANNENYHNTLAGQYSKITVKNDALPSHQLTNVQLKDINIQGSSGHNHYSDSTFMLN